MSAIHDAQLLQTQNLINSDTFMIALVRAPQLKATLAGGRIREGSTTQLASTARFFAVVSPDDLLSVTGPGNADRQYGVLVGMPGDDIQADDRFEARGLHWRVIYVHILRDYEVRAECESVG